MQRQITTTLKKHLGGCRRIAVLGAGSDLRGDDAAGVMVVREMRELISEGPLQYLKFEGLEEANTPEKMTGFIKSFKPTHILLVDAAEIGAAVGECREIAISEISESLFSTHTLPMKLVTNYLEQAAGAVITVLGIQPGRVDFDKAPTPELTSGVKRLSSCLYDVLRNFDHRSLLSACVYDLLIEYDQCA